MAKVSASSESTGAALSLVRELVEIETPSGDRAASAAIAALLSERMRALGGEVTSAETENGTNLLAEFAGTGDPVLLIGHTDTVWPVGTLAEAVPWSLDGDRVAGPGAYDMKAGIAIMLTAIARLDSRRRPPLRIVLVCDEEVGSPTSQPFLRAAAEGCAAALGFEAPHPDGAFKLGRFGSVRARLTVTGRAAHAALEPERGVSAVDELIDQLLRVREITTEPSRPPVLCNIGAISGGGRTNVIADHAQADIGLRFADTETEAEVLAELGALAPIRDGARLDLEMLSRRPTWQASEADQRLHDAVRQAATAAGCEPDARVAAGGGDTNLVGSLGIPTLDGLGPRGGGAHATDEHFSLESLGQRIELLEALLPALSQG